MERHIAVLDSDHNAIGVIVADDKVNERFRELISAHHDADLVVHGKIALENVFENDALFITVAYQVDEDFYDEKVRLQQVSIF